MCVSFLLLLQTEGISGWKSSTTQKMLTRRRKRLSKLKKKNNNQVVVWCKPMCLIWFWMASTHLHTNIITNETTTTKMSVNKCRESGHLNGNPNGKRKKPLTLISFCFYYFFFFIIIFFFFEFFTWLII